MSSSDSNNKNSSNTSKPLPAWLTGVSIGSFIGGMVFSRVTFRVVGGIALGSLVGMVIEQEFGMPDVKAMVSKITHDSREWLQPTIDKVDKIVKQESERVDAARRPDRRDR